MATQTTASINLGVTVSQRSSDETSSASYGATLAYTKSYSSGLVTGTVNQVFCQSGTLGSGATGNFNLTGLSENLLGNTIIKSFTGISSFTIKNTSPRPGFNITLNLSSSSGFKSFLGGPTGNITLYPNSCIHQNTAGNLYPVNSTSRHVQLIDGGSGASYAIALCGQ